MALNEPAPRIRVISSDEMKELGTEVFSDASETLSFTGENGFADFSRSQPIMEQRIPMNLGQRTRLPVGFVREPAAREGYDYIEENDFRSVVDNPLSTFSVDVDTASCSNMRRMIEGGGRPLPDAIRIEELINYFKYDYEEPTGEVPFSVNIE